MSELDELRIRLREFADERCWDQFHSPKNLVMALCGEVGELVEVFQWLSIEDSMPENLCTKDIARCKEEIADILIYLVRLADKLKIDPVSESMAKIAINKERYPVSLSKGNAVKYNLRDD
ncbi:nucleotide pyrophosphohydrolase [Synechococcus sp. CCY 9618]|uniref:nucleotide pyrophosphohydrolase n=1 Tax=Synechococcus sp. CCY 9618 TaxID=2815602 RepID=UPI00352F6AC8